MAVLLVVTALLVVALNANTIYSTEGLAYISDANDPNEPEPESVLIPDQINCLICDPNEPNEPEPENYL